jgi:hypothetical protein
MLTITGFNRSIGSLAKRRRIRGTICKSLLVLGSEPQAQGKSFVLPPTPSNAEDMAQRGKDKTISNRGAWLYHCAVRSSSADAESKPDEDHWQEEYDES